ncbi:phage tail protein [Cloacibacillus evryensis]|uniref:phage tail protein n=1 Tax=Cloacibacillus evryensis TaxID=508460 RepID=UPI00146FA9F4|nr:phage tail protein [Cloacibacillus evryensis]MEA5034038.1 phage tail protein [Cloacibacillus evryensis]
MVRTFSELQQKNSARYAEHEVIGKKPLLEFLGPGLEEISFKLQLMSSLGVKPDEEVKVLQEMRDAGEVGQLIFGEIKIGKFVIVDLSQQEGPRDRHGAPTWIEVELTIKEYVSHADK